MAKKNAKNNERRAMVEQMRAEQARKERMRSLAILGTCVAIVLALVGYAGFTAIKDSRAKNKLNNTALTKIGVSTAAAACDPIITRKPTGTSVSGTAGSHVAIGTSVSYPYAPPAFGQHWPNFLTGPEYRNFYAAGDRPEVERLVHSLEHGHTLVWYDETIKPGSTQYKDLQAIAGKYNGSTTYVNIVPWLSTDGSAFPSGKHVAITHWAGKGGNQQGIWEYCGQVSGAVINDFVKKYPNGDAPEGGAQ